MKPALARVSAATRGRMLVLSRNEMVSAVLLEVGPGDCRHANASTFGPYIVLVIRDASMALKSTSPSAGLAHPAVGRRVGWRGPSFSSQMAHGLPPTQCASAKSAEIGCRLDHS